MVRTLRLIAPLNIMTEGSLEVKLPTICRDAKAEVGRVSEEKSRSEKIRWRKSNAGARKGREVANHAFFPMICGSGGSKSNLAKAAGAEPAGRKIVRCCGLSQKVSKTYGLRPLLEVGMSQKCTPLRRESHVQVKM